MLITDIKRNDGNVHMVELDYYYFRNWSVWMDIYILIKPPSTLQKRGMLSQAFKNPDYWLLKGV